MFLAAVSNLHTSNFSQPRICIKVEQCASLSQVSLPYYVADVLKCWQQNVVRFKGTHAIMFVETSNIMHSQLKTRFSVEESHTKVILS